MGDQCGKKDKEKGQKQKAEKQKQKSTLIGSQKESLDINHCVHRPTDRAY